MRGRRGGSPRRGFEAFLPKPRRVVVPISQVRSLRLGLVTFPRSCSKSDLCCRFMGSGSPDESRSNLRLPYPLPPDPPHNPRCWPWGEVGPGAFCWKVSLSSPTFATVRQPTGAWELPIWLEWQGCMLSPFQGWGPLQPCLGLLPLAIEGSRPRGACCAQDVQKSCDVRLPISLPIG